MGFGDYKVEFTVPCTKTLLFWAFIQNRVRREDRKFMLNSPFFPQLLLCTRKCPLRGHILAPPEGLRAPELPVVNPGGQPGGSGGDPKVI